MIEASKLLARPCGRAYELKAEGRKPPGTNELKAEGRKPPGTNKLKAAGRKPPGTITPRGCSSLFFGTSGGI